MLQDTEKEGGIKNEQSWETAKTDEEKQNKNYNTIIVKHHYT